jgi:hypothetical protein
MKYGQHGTIAPKLSFNDFPRRAFAEYFAPRLAIGGDGHGCIDLGDRFKMVFPKLHGRKGASAKPLEAESNLY